MSKFFRNTINYLLIMFLVIIFIYCLFQNQDLNFLGNSSYVVFFLTIIISFLLFFFIHVLFKRIDKSKHLKLIRIIAMLFIIVIQVVMISIFDVQQVTDSYSVEDHAYPIAVGLANKVDHSLDDYFVVHSNNNFDLVLNIILIKIIKFIKILKVNVGLEIFALLCIDISLILLYKLAREFLDEKTSTKILVLNILNPLNYFMVFWTYTCAYSVPFVIGILYLAVKLKKSDKNIKTVIYSCLFALVAIICFYLRPVIVIPLIAILICFFMFKEKGHWKKYLMSFSIILIVCLGVGALINNSFNRLIPQDKNDCFPVTHYLMMGLHNRGGWNSRDVIYTQSRATTKEKKAANIKEIKRTLKEYKVSGLLAHEIDKLPVTWANGSSRYYNFLSQDRNTNNSLNKWVIGDKKDLVAISCNAYRLLIVLFAIFGTFVIIRNKKYDKLFLVTLTLFGAMLFYLLWESKDVYSYPFLSLLGFISCLGLCDKLKDTTKLDKSVYVLTAILICTILFALKYNLTMANSNMKDYRLNVSPASNYGNVDNLLLKDTKITQSFDIEGKFNIVAIYANKIKENDNFYKIKLYKNNKFVTEYIKSYKDIYENYIMLKLPSGVGTTGKYKLEISSADNNRNRVDNLRWKFVTSHGLDNYKGKLNIDNKSNLGDLSIKVYNKSITRYMSSKLFFLLYIVVIVLLCLEYRNLYKKEK